jgi:hypothetical protein
MTGIPSFTSSREHPPARRWSGVKQAPWRLRAQCRCCDFIQPGQPHYTVTQPGPDGAVATAVVCEGAYRRAREAPDG